jgi:hypothetical protein
MRARVLVLAVNDGDDAGARMAAEQAARKAALAAAKQDPNRKGWVEDR